MQFIIDSITASFNSGQLPMKAAEALHFLNVNPQEVQSFFLDGMVVVQHVLLATFILELVSLDTAKIILAKDQSLYWQGVVSNFVNHCIYGIPIYALGAMFCRKMDQDASYDMMALQVVGILFIHGVSYYQMHKTFHTYTSLYKHHKFHHRFHSHVTPMVAHAVTFVEYMLAYVLPFALAGATMRPYYSAYKLCVYIIAFTNLSIHTPRIEAWSERTMPAWLVSTHNHMEHHKKLTVHYGAPTWNVDWVVENLFGSTSNDVAKKVE